MKIRIKILHVVIGAAIITVGGFSFWVIRSLAESESCHNNYKWVNQNIKCKKPVIDKALYNSFKTVLADKINNWKDEGKVKDVGVFFRDLESGPTFGINEQMTFVPASLLKMPVMLLLFKLAEEDSGLLSRTLRYSGDLPLEFSQNYKPGRLLESGKVYTIDELIFRMIAYSDNRAYFLLIDYLRKLSPEDDLILRTYIELGMLIDNDRIDAADLSTKTYASIFRILYNMSYLSGEFSDKALGYLARSDFNEGIVRGVPENIVVAHKFGERGLEDEIKQLHDCGVVYYPDNPYLLCIMTSGEDASALAKVIGDISYDVYREVDSRRK